MIFTRAETIIRAESELTFWREGDKRIGIGERELSVLNFRFKGVHERTLNGNNIPGFCEAKRVPFLAQVLSFKL